jgi:hypothetical protein
LKVRSPPLAGRDQKERRVIIIIYHGEALNKSFRRIQGLILNSRLVYFSHTDELIITPRAAFWLRRRGGGGDSHQTHENSPAGGHSTQIKIHLSLALVCVCLRPTDRWNKFNANLILSITISHLHGSNFVIIAQRARRNGSHLNNLCIFSDACALESEWRCRPRTIAR